MKSLQSAFNGESLIPGITAATRAQDMAMSPIDVRNTLARAIYGDDAKADADFTLSA